MAQHYASDVVNVAKGEIGVKESPKNSNKQKYGEEYGVNGTPWCVQFVWWVFKHAGAASLFYGGKKTAYAPTLMKYYKNKGQFVNGGYKPGDLLFLDFNSNGAADHMGIVEKVSGSKVYTIEGNTGTGNDTNGGAVMRRTRTASNILGAGRPAYTQEEITVTVKLRQIESGSKGDDVKSAQMLLNGHGHNSGAADGIFGTKTTEATKAFQKANKLTADGIIGTKTWNKLLGIS